MAETERNVAKVISDLGRPVKTRELLAIMSQRGFEVGGQDPVSTLSARLSRSQHIVNDRALGWMTKEMADGKMVSSAMPSASVAPSGPVEPEAGGGT